MEPGGRSPEGSMGRRAFNPMVDICGARYDNGITEGRWGICLFLLEDLPLTKSVRPGLTASFLPLVVVSG